MQGFSGGFSGNFQKAPSVKINAIDFNGLIENIKTSATQIGDSFNDFQEDVFEMYDDAVENFENWRDDLFGDISELAKEAQANIAENSKALLEGIQNSVSVFLDGLATTAATGAMIVGAALNGIGNFAEDLLDFVVICGAAVLTVPAALIDGVSYLFTGQGVGAIDGLWAGTQAFVATEWVNSGFEWFYTETGVGQAINGESIDFFQYGNTGYEGAKTVGYIAGTIALTVVTAGAGGGVVSGANAAKTGAVAVAKAGAKSGVKLAFASGTSRGTSEAWNDNTASISAGNDNLDIKLNNEEKANLEKGITVSKNVDFVDENGNLITDEIQFVKNEDGSYSALYGDQRLQVTIDGTGVLEGLGYGIVSGSWEAAQWAAGGKLAGMGIKAVGFDIVSGAVDVPFRSGLQALYSGQTFEERFENNGGFSGMALNAAIAGGFSGGFEYAPKLKAAVQNANINKSPSFKNISGNISRVFHGIAGKSVSLVKGTGIAIRNVAFSGPALFGKVVCSPLIKNGDITLKAYTEGIYHVTSDEAADAIINSGKVKASNRLTSYGSKKSFFFAGIPSAGNLAENVALKPTFVAVKINPTSEQLGQLRYRNLGDNAVTHAGDFDFIDKTASKVFLGLKNENGKLVYKEISEAEYNNYNLDLTSEQMKLVDGSAMSKFKSELFGFNSQIENTMASQAKAISSVVGNITNGFEQAGAVVISKMKSIFFSDEAYRLNLKASSVFDSLFKGRSEYPSFSSVTLDELIDIQKKYYKASQVSGNPKARQFQLLYREKYLKYFEDYFSNLQFSYSTASPTITAMDAWKEYKKYNIFLPEASPYKDHFKKVPFSEFRNNFYPKVDENLQKIQGDIQSILDEVNSIHFDKNVDKNINSLLDDPSIQIGIHKTGGVSEEINESIRRKGLFIHGAQAQGVSEYNSPLQAMNMEDIERTVRLFDDGKMAFYNYLTSNYKNYETYSLGKDGFIIAYPKNITPEQLYYWNDETSSWHIHPQYIYGHSKIGSDGKSVAVEFNPSWYNAKENFTNNNLRSLLKTTDINAINIVYSSIEAKYPGHGLVALQQFVQTGDYNLITRTNGARDIIKQYSPKDIQDYLDIMSGDSNLQMAKAVDNIASDFSPEAINKNGIDSRLKMSELEIKKVQTKIQDVENSLEQMGVLTSENKAVFDAILFPLKNGIKIDPVFEKILLNIDLCIKQLPNFRAYLADDSVAASFNYILSQLKIGGKTSDYSNGATSSFVALHEFGHLLFNTLKGSSQTHDFGGFLGSIDYLAALPNDKITSVIKNAQESISKNSGQVSQLLIKNEEKWKVIRAEASHRFSKIADSEALRVSKNVDELFSSEQTYKIESMLRNAGISEERISILMENPEMIKSIFEKSNGIDIINIMHDDIASLANDELGKTNLDRMLNSIVQSESYEGIHFKYLHEDSYWHRSGSEEGACRDSYDELMADYFAFMASGRDNWMEEFKGLVGDELVDSLYNEYASMLQILEEKGNDFR